MSRRWIRSSTAVAVLASSLLFTAGAGALQGPSDEKACRGRFTIRLDALDGTWTLVQELWRGLTAVWAPEGTIADPNGNPGPAGAGAEGTGSAGATGEEGTIADPNG